MNYRHAYHAGSFADVYKHIVLITILEYLCKKEKPFCYVDTHAGAGKYYLSQTKSQKTGEFKSGISQIFANHQQKPQVIEHYLNIIRNMNSTGTLQFYPGSPCITHALLRPQDKMILTELNPTDLKLLKQEFHGDQQVSVHLLDGYQALKAFLPPHPRRGLVFIDPPYEISHEFATILNNLPVALKCWQEGIYLIWYPVKNRPRINFFQRQLQRSILKPLLMTEFNLYPDDSPFALNGSGMIVVNPPWQLDKALKEVLPWLQKELDKNRQGNFRLNYL